MKSYKHLTLKPIKKTKKKEPIDEVAISKRNQEIYKMHKEGMPFRKIASLFNISSTKAFNVVCKIDYDKLCK
jgi:DNA-binding NarL/FixJ family response regulator